ncbi:hypothetical protein Tco_0145316, partial [Tanacetum coccineum]
VLVMILSKNQGLKMIVIVLVFSSLDSRKLALKSRCDASLAKLVKDVVKPNLTHLRFKRRREPPVARHGFLAARLAISEPPAARLAGADVF